MLDTLGSLGDWSDLEDPTKAPKLPTTPAAPAQSASFDQAWNQSASAGAPPTDLYQQTGAAGTGASAANPTAMSGAAAPAAPAPQAPATPDYTAHVQAVSSAATPQDAAVAHDTLARTLASDLTNDGHDVSWEGTQLMVDGRPYDVAGADQVNGATPQPGMIPDFLPTTPPGQVVPIDAPIPTSSTSSRQTADNWIAFTNQLAGYTGEGGAFDASAGRSGASQAATAARGNLQPLVDQFNAQYGTHAVVVSGDRVDFGDGRGPQDVIRDVGNGQGAFTGGWNEPTAGAPGAGGGGGGAYGLPDVWSEGPLTPAGSTAAAPVTPGAAPNYDALWSASTPAYEAGSIDTNPALPGQADTLAAAGSYEAGTLGDANLGWDYNSLLADMQSGNPVQDNTDSLTNWILEHPESMDPKTVAMLKAQSDEEQGQAALSEDEATKRFGFSSGLADSPWLASERAATARSADASQIANRRTIDITAAQTNQADRLKAATLGANYQAQRAGQKQSAVSTAASASLGKAGQETSRFTANEGAKQAQAQSRMQAVQLSVDTAFKAAAEGRDRVALNESLKQEATKLGITQDQLTQTYTLSTLADLTKRYGIDIGAQIDQQKLAEQSKEFQQDLLVKVQQMKVLAAQWQAEMEQRDRQFGSNLGLQYDVLNSNNLNHWWDSVGGGA